MLTKLLIKDFFLSFLQIIDQRLKFKFDIDIRFIKKNDGITHDASVHIIVISVLCGEEVNSIGRPSSRV